MLHFRLSVDLEVDVLHIVYDFSSIEPELILCVLRLCFWGPYPLPGVCFLKNFLNSLSFRIVSFRVRKTLDIVYRRRAEDVQITKS